MEYRRTIATSTPSLLTAMRGAAGMRPAGGVVVACARAPIGGAWAGSNLPRCAGESRTVLGPPRTRVSLARPHDGAEIVDGAPALLRESLQRGWRAASPVAHGAGQGGHAFGHGLDNALPEVGGGGGSGEEAKTH